MYKNYFKIAFRQLINNKFYSAINILGLAIGLTSCFLILIYVQDELSYDRFHEKRDRIYRIVETFKTGEGVITTGLTPYKLALDLKEQFPEIEKVVRIDYDILSDIVQYGDKEILEKTITSVDPDFFDVFSFKLFQGNPKTALLDPNTVVISDEKAKVYFPTGNAMGKILSFKNPYTHNIYTAKVTGIFEAMPKNSHFHKDFLLSTATADILIPDRKEQLGWTSHFSYLFLSATADPKKLEKAINEYIFKKYPKQMTDWWSYFPLQSINDIHLHSNLKEELEPNGDIAYIYIFSAIAMVIILLAGINYMNLATARAATRAKEIGIRKVVGALKTQLIFQLIGEALILSLLAFLISCVLVTVFLPVFNSLSGKELEIHFSNAGLLIKFMGLALFIGILAGSYPAFFLSSFQPVSVLKGAVSKAGFKSLLLRKGLVVFQFSLSIILIIGTIIIYRQWNYLQNKKLGINSEEVVIVQVQTKKEDLGYPVLKKELLRNPNILHVTASQKDITSRFGNYTTFSMEGKELVMPLTEVDADFFKTFNISFLAGSDFKPDSDSDSTKDYIVNEAALHLMGIKNPVGIQIHFGDQKANIIGVVKDFHLESLHSEISPVIFYCKPYGFSYFVIKIKPADIKGSIAFIETQFKKIDAEAPFQYSFLDDNIDKLYKTEAKFFTVFTTFACLAIFIACIGIFGLASFTAYQRTKEIGIRKILGASVRSISLHLTGGFIKLVLLSNIIAWPVAFYLMNRWLENFPYKIDIGWEVFMLAATMALLIALLTVSFQAIKAALANPVKSLRAE